jgi:hypothetical protein
VVGPQQQDHVARYHRECLGLEIRHPPIEMAPRHHQLTLDLRPRA